MGKKDKLTSDGVWQMGDWNVSDANTGSVSEIFTVEGMSYEFGQLDFDYDEKLREKYPALKDAWNHYHNVKKMCEAKEQEDEN